jgi:Xaa-Pro aminopeptidase
MASSVAIFTSEGNAHLIVPEDERELAAATSSARLIPYSSVTLQHLTSAAEAIEGPLSETLSSIGLTGRAGARVGVQMKQGVQPASYAVSTLFRGSLNQTLARIAPRLELVPCDDLFEREKSIRTPVELNLMRHAMKFAARGFHEAPQAISHTADEHAVAALVQGAFEASPLPPEIQRSYGFFFCMSGPNSATASAAYARTRQRAIADGDLVMIHANTCCDGFWTDLTRTYTAGEPSTRHKEIRAAIFQARAAALAAIRPGVPAREVDSAARQVMASHGLGEAFRHGLGHGVGYAAANALALPRIHPESPDILLEGMTFNIEPAAYFDGYGGMRHCDVVAVTSTGVEVLSEF